MISLAEVAQAVASGANTNLDAWGPTTFGANQVFRTEKPRRWVWVPISESFAAAEKRDGSLCQRLVSVQIHSWGLNEAECEAMQQAVISALRVVLNGRRVLPTASQWTSRQDAHRGAALVTTVTIELPMPRTALPLNAAALPDVTQQTVVPTASEITPAVED